MTFGAVRSVVSRFAARRARVLVLEDLHWADPTSLRFTVDCCTSSPPPAPGDPRDRPGPRPDPEVEALMRWPSGGETLAEPDADARDLAIARIVVPARVILAGP